MKCKGRGCPPFVQNSSPNNTPFPAFPAKAGIHLRFSLYYNPMAYAYVYILASKKNGTLYTGVTSDLIKRVNEHKNDARDGFTKRYQVHSLVYYESHDDINSARTREKQIKAWKRQWKINLIEKENPEWVDLYPGLLE